MAYDEDTGALANASLSYSVWIDPTMATEYQELAANSLAAWSLWVQELHVPLTIGSCPSGDHVICIRLATADEDAATPGGDIGLDAHADNGSSTIILFPDRWTASGMDIATTEHEFGHAFGLMHVGPGALMSPNFAIGAHEITEPDVEQFWSLRGKNPDVPSAGLATQPL